MTDTLPASVAIPTLNPAIVGAASSFLAFAKTNYAVIKDADMYAAAAEDLKQGKAQYNLMESERKAATSDMRKAIDRVNGWFKKPTEDYLEAETVIKKGMLAFQVREEAARRAREAEIAEANRKAQEKLNAQAEKAAAAGKAEKAEALREQAAAVPTVVELATTTPKVAGMSTRGMWKARVKDPLAFRAYVGQHPEWAHLVEDNMPALHGLARSQKGALAIPGVEAYEEQILSSRAA